MKQPAMFHVFTPQRDQPEELEKILVKRNALLDSAVAKIRESVISKDKHRLLFIGPRGLGKSFLVTLIHHRLSTQEDLVEKVRFAWLNEDQTSTTFLHLLMRIYRKLVDLYPTEFPSEELDKIRSKDPADAREVLGQAMIRHLAHRTVVLLIENLDAIFHAMSEVEQRTWRGFLQDHPCFAIVSTAQGLTKNISSKTKPFFGFFDIHHLEPLTVDEAAELLEKIAALNGDQPLANFIASPRGKARMRAIHHLSGGNPRLYLILSDFLTKDSLDNLVRLFEETVDRQLTPYFQERMRWLSPQQQEIVQYLCQQVHPASVKEISEGIFTKPNTVSSQLKQLREKGYLASKGRGKESFYELTEPLMRLSFQVKEVNHRQPLTLIVNFMRVWYDRPELEKRLGNIIPGTWGRDYFEVALQKINLEGNVFRHSLMLACLADIDCDNCDTHQLTELKGIAEETNDINAWWKYGSACLVLAEFEECIIATTHVIESLGFSPELISQAYTLRAISKLRQKQPRDAIEDLTSAIKIADIEDSTRAIAAYARANLLSIQGDSALAISDLTLVINNMQLSPKHVADALIIRAKCYADLDLYDDAFKDWEKALEIPEIGTADTAKALTERAMLRFKLKSYDEVLSDCNYIVGLPDIPAEHFAVSHCLRASCEIMRGNLTNAKSDLDVVCNLKECPELYRGLSLLLRSGLYQKNGDLQQAANDLVCAVEASRYTAPDALLKLARVHLEMNQYEQSLGSLIQLLSLPLKESLLQDTGQYDFGNILIHTVYGLRKKSENWKTAMKKILPTIVERSFAIGLATALVRHLEKLKNEDLNHSALDLWVADWESVVVENEEMHVGIRMLQAGVAWIKTKDDGALLDLVKEERSIVRQALGLKDED
jgi:tetratricopeptide (TPR) repeat protein